MPIERIPEITKDLLMYFEDMYPEICSRIDREGVVTDEDIEAIKKSAASFVDSRDYL